MLLINEQRLVNWVVVIIIISDQRVAFFHPTHP